MQNRFPFQQRDDEALVLLGEVLAKAGEPALLARAENLAGDLQVERDPALARRLLESAVARLKTFPDAYLAAHLALSLAWLAAVDGDVAQAKAACRAGLQQALDASSPGRVGTSHLRLAQVLRCAGRLAEAREHAQAAATVGRDNGWQVLVDEAGRVLPDGA